MTNQSPENVNKGILRSNYPVTAAPGIGRRTGALLQRAGITTIGQFLELPELLLSSTFGPSVLAVRRHTQTLIQEPKVPGAYDIFQNIFGIFA